MKFETTPVPDLVLSKSDIYGDDRGSFMRLYCAPSEEREGLAAHTPVQINISISRHKGTLRGLHFQRSPAQESKTVRCLRGRIFDVAVDLRTGSPTFLQHFGVTLCAGDGLALLMPEGFAHGFQALEDDTEVLYLHGAPYQPEFEGGILFDDPVLGIKWPLPPTVMSDRDKGFLPLSHDFKGITA